jgi:hypothetical protein
MDSKHNQIGYYHQCLRSILQDLLRVNNNEHGHDLYISGYGMIQAHFKLSLVIGDTEGHDKVALITVPAHQTSSACHATAICHKVSVMTLMLLATWLKWNKLRPL